MITIKEIRDVSIASTTNPKSVEEFRNCTFDTIVFNLNGQDVEAVLYKAGKKITLIENQNIYKLSEQQNDPFTSERLTPIDDDYVGSVQSLMYIKVGTIKLDAGDVLVVTQSRTGVTSMTAPITLLETELNNEYIRSYRKTSLDAVQLKNVVSVYCRSSNSGQKVFIKLADYENELLHLYPFLFKSPIPQNLYIEKDSTNEIYYVEIITVETDLSRAPKKYNKIVNQNSVAQKMSKQGIIPTTLINTADHINQQLN